MCYHTVHSAQRIYVLLFIHRIESPRNVHKIKMKIAKSGPQEGLFDEIKAHLIISCNCPLKGSVQRKLRPRLLYIIQNLFSWRWAAENKIFTFLKGQFTIYIKPLQRSCSSPVTFACKSNWAGT